MCIYFHIKTEEVFVLLDFPCSIVKVSADNGKESGIVGVPDTVYWSPLLIEG